jgi:hypothetical protein
MTSNDLFQFFEERLFLSINNDKSRGLQIMNYIYLPFFVAVFSSKLKYVSVSVVFRTSRSRRSVQGHRRRHSRQRSRQDGLHADLRRGSRVHNFRLQGRWRRCHGLVVLRFK